MKEIYSVSKRLKELRSHIGMTQEEFAEYAEISYKFYQQIEAGRKKMIRLDTVQRLAEAYGIELWEFFYPEIPKISLKKTGVKIDSSPHRKKRKNKNEASAKLENEEPQK